MRGRKPLPNAVKRLTGSRWVNEQEPAVDMTRPRCPSWLSKEAKAEWRRVAPRLHAAGILSALDRTALAAYCASYARWREASEALATQDPVIVSPKGGQYQNPWVGVMRGAQKDMLRLAGQFGMLPAERGRLTVAPPPPKTLEQELFERVQRAAKDEK